jgi:hypothetical protein
LTCTIGTVSIRSKMSKDHAFGSLPRQAFSGSLLERAAALRDDDAKLAALLRSERAGWQDRIAKVVGRVAEDLISNDEAEVSEVVRRRLFEDLGSDANLKKTARGFAEWCFERRAQLPPEWTQVDTATSERSAREMLRQRFEAWQIWPRLGRPRRDVAGVAES